MDWKILNNWLKYFYLYIIIQKYIIFSILIVSFIHNFHFDEIIILNNTTEEDDYIIKRKKYYLKLGIIKQFNTFLNICKRGELIDKTKYPLLKAPKISVIIPIYNGGKYLNYSLRTIQNQKLKEVEIIIIDDCSTDDSLNYIEKLMEEEARIRLIKNFKNRKILYSKSIAALNCNGEFILELDQDDMFIREDLFHILYKESKKYNLDLVQFRDFVKEDFSFNRLERINFGKLHWIPPKKSFYIQKPELKATLFKNESNYLLWGLLINSELYKKAIYIIWEFLVNYKFIFNEDYISSTMILILSCNYKYLNIFGILHLKHQNAASFNSYIQEEFYLSNIIFPKYLYDYHIKNNPEDIQLIINYINLNKLYQNKASFLFPKFFEFNIRSFLYNKYLLSNDRKNIFDLFNIQKNYSHFLTSFSYFMNNHEYNSILKFQNSIINRTKKKKNHIYHMKINNNTKPKEIYLQYIFVNYSCSVLNINKMITLYLMKNKSNDEKIYPKISIIIYCKEIKYLEQTLISIIEQKSFFFFEIIIVYDNKDKMCLSANFKYKNILILNNLNQKGIMYSFAIGALASKGKYIMNFQSGYTFAKSEFLQRIYKLANDKHIDVLEFNLLINKDDYIKENSFNLYKCFHFNTSLNTNIIKYNENYKEIDLNKELLINKLIRSKIYKNIINKYQLLDYERRIYNYYDDIIIFLLNKEKYIFKHIDIFGVIKNINYVHSLRLNQLMNNEEQKIADSIFYINFLFDNSENSYRKKKFVYDEFINILALVYNKKVPKTNDSIKLFQKFMKCKYINEIEKLELNFFYNSLNN